MWRFRLSYVCLLLMFIIIADGCRHESPEEEVPMANSNEIFFRWNQAYDNQTREVVETGMRWGLSYLGASLSTSTYSKAIIWDGNIMKLNLAAAGFNPNTLASLQKLTGFLKESGEYKTQKSLDMGRFLALTIGSPWNYYAITRVPENYFSSYGQTVFQAVPAGITVSTISGSHRKIYIGEGESMVFVAHEGPGSIKDGSFEVHEYEVLDVMPNGQIRFAIYDSSGHLVPYANSSLGNAGKTGKCIWCHEIGPNPSFAPSEDVPGYLSRAQFNAAVDSKRHMLDQQRMLLKTSIDYFKRQDHTYMELLYISFMEPSAERLASEWGIPLDMVKKILEGLSTHTHSEFPFLGTLYEREEVDKRAPYASLRVPSSIREPSVYDPKLLP